MRIVTLSLLLAFSTLFGGRTSFPDQNINLTEEERHNREALSKYSVVVIHQFGKVGSTSLFESFKQLCPAIFTHPADPIHKLLRQNNSKKFLVINTMRNIFERNISCLFEHIRIGRLKMHRNYNLQDLINRYPKFNFSENQFLKNFYSGFNQLLRLHIFEQPFDFTNKYYFESHDKYDVLIMRYEDIGQWPQILEKALNLRNITIPWERKSINPFYNEFKMSIRYSQKEVEEILSIDYMGHFYTQDELNSLVEKYVDRS